MGWGVRRFAVVLGALLCALVGATAARADGLQLVSQQRLDSRLLDLTFRTDALTSETHVRVLVPADYDASAPRRYPVLYLLHGAIDDDTSWTVKGDAEHLTAGLPLIVVMPDAGGVEPEYTVSGWHVAIDRPALEFSRLAGASRAGFALSGSGAATVTTPPDYTAGRAYRVRVEGPQPSESLLRASRDRRLTIPVGLGPGNTAQEDTPGAQTAVRTATVRIT